MINDEDFHKIIKETVYETLSGLGLDTKNLLETQADMIYLHKLRKGSEDLYGKARLILLTTVIPGSIYFIWDALKNKIKGG